MSANVSEETQQKIARMLDPLSKGETGWRRITSELGLPDNSKLEQIVERLYINHYGIIDYIENLQGRSWSRKNAQ